MAEQDFPLGDPTPPPSGFDERQQAVLEGGHFFEPYKEELHALFTALGREDKWSDDPRDPEFLQYIREKWIGGEHGNSATKDQFTPDEEKAAEPILNKLGLLNEVIPPDNTHYDEILIVGGFMTANYRRMQFVINLMQNHGITADRIVILLGQRSREESRDEAVSRDGTDEELLDAGGRFAGNDIHQNPWVIKMQEAVAASEGGQQMFPTETEIGRAAVMKTMPGGENLVARKVALQVTDVTGLSEEQALAALPPKIGNLPPRLATDYYFEVPIEINGKTRMQEVVLLNGAAVERTQGDPRHTTASVTDEWLERLAPKPSDQPHRVLYISGNPNTLRTAYDSLKIIKEAGRPDVQMDIAGTGTILGRGPGKIQIQNALGEVARMIHNDVRMNYQ